MMGKKVIITGPRSKEDYNLDECFWIENMDIYIGEEAIITGENNELFNIDIDNGEFVWAKEWLDMEGA